MEIGEAVRAARLAQGLSRPQLARLVGVHKCTIECIEHNGPSTKETLRRINAVLRSNIAPPSDWKEEPRKRYQQAVLIFHEEIKRWAFVPGKEYQIEKTRLLALRKEGIHHIFKSAKKGVEWLTCYTDQQLVGAQVEEA